MEDQFLLNFSFSEFYMLLQSLVLRAEPQEQSAKIGGMALDWRPIYPCQGGGGTGEVYAGKGLKKARVVSCMCDERIDQWGDDVPMPAIRGVCGKGRMQRIILSLWNMTVIAYGNVPWISDVLTPAVKGLFDGANDGADGEGMVGGLVWIAVDNAKGTGLVVDEVEALAEIVLIGAITEVAVQPLALGAFHLLYEGPTIIDDLALYLVRSKGARMLGGHNSVIHLPLVPIVLLWLGDGA